MNDAGETPGDGPGDHFRHLQRNMVQNAMKIWNHEDAVHKLDPDHFDVLSLRTPGRRVRVYRRGDQWRCRSDKTNNQDQPCAHILVVLIYEGIVELPNTAASVWTKTKEGRNHAAENEAWQLVPTKLPALLAQLLRDGLPVIAPEPEPNPLGGRPFKPIYPQVYQAVLRVALRQSHRSSRGALDATDHRAHNPYGNVGVATLCRFLANAETTPILEKLLALSTWPAKPYESVFHPDGTGLTEQHFSAYFDERYMKRKKDRKRPDPEFVGPPKPEAEARLHHWTYAEILWTYRYTLIAAIHAQQGPFGEAPWLIPLLERTRLMLDVAELGGDKAYDANYIYQYARSRGIEPQIKIRRGHDPTRASLRNKFRKRQIESKRLDPHGFAARANRRNNAETGNHAFKAILGDQIYSKGPVAQRNEILCMCIAYNLTRLVYLGVDRGIQIDFGGGAQVLSRVPWVPLPSLHEQYRGVRGQLRPEWT